MTHYGMEGLKAVLIHGHRTIVTKGLIEVLTERGCCRQKMKVDEMRAVIALHPEFKEEKCKLENFLASCGHSCQFLPKYHCECWAQAKRHTRAYCNYNITGLRRNIPTALDKVSAENIDNYLRRVRVYMFGYLLGHQAGVELQELVNKFSKEYKSHSRVAENQ